MKCFDLVGCPWIAEDNKFTSLFKVQQHSKSSLYVDIFLVVSSKHITDI